MWYRFVNSVIPSCLIASVVLGYLGGDINDMLPHLLMFPIANVSIKYFDITSEA